MGTACATESEAEDNLIQGFGRTTFAQLGWGEDVVIAADSPPAIVRFRLPEGAAQGEPLWYGVRLKFLWQGTPGYPGDYAFLNGRWNDKAFYQFKAKKDHDLDSGFRWSMVDIVNGHNQGHELTDSVRVASTNIVQVKAIKEGDNELRFSLGLRDATNGDISAVIHKESEVMVTSWQPTFVDGSAKAKVNDNIVDVQLKGKNLGWGAHSLTAKVLIWSDIHQDKRLSLIHI